MSKMNFESFLVHFAQLFEETAPEGITADTRFRDLEEWSSLMALSVIAMTDEQYGITLSGEDVRTSETVHDLYDKIKGK